ncbi:hypothetical protein D3C85_159420 [compost metagenome]
MSQVVDLELIQREWFHDTRSFRAACYACRRYNYMVHQATQGFVFFDLDGMFVPELKVEYGEQFRVLFKDGENAWIARVGDVRDGDSGKIWMIKKTVNEWLSQIRYIDPTNLKRIRLG